MRRIRRDTRGVSNIIVVSLGLVIVIAIVVNIVLWNYELNQLDWEKMREEIDITSVSALATGTLFTFKNEGSSTVHLVSLWVNNATDHQRYDINLFVNAGDTESYLHNDINLPNKPYVIKVVTERGNTAVYSES